MRVRKLQFRLHNVVSYFARGQKDRITSGDVKVGARFRICIVAQWRKQIIHVQMNQKKGDRKRFVWLEVRIRNRVQTVVTRRV